MRWDDVIEVIADAAAADEVLEGIYGSAIRMAGTVEHSVPSLEYTLLSDNETELWNPILVQWDQFVDTIEQLVDSERALRRLFDHDMPIWLDGVLMWSEFTEGTVLTGPDQNGYFGRVIRFRHTPVKSAMLIEQGS